MFFTVWFFHVLSFCTLLVSLLCFLTVGKVFADSIDGTLFQYHQIHKSASMRVYELDWAGQRWYWAVTLSEAAGLQAFHEVGS